MTDPKLAKFCGKCGAPSAGGQFCASCGMPVTNPGAQLPGFNGSNQGPITIGRAVENDLVLPDPLVSKFHARIEPGNPPMVVDQESFHGTFVEGVRVERVSPLHPGAEVVFGNRGFVWDGRALAPLARPQDSPFSADRLSVELGGRRLLQDVTFTLKPRSLTAVIGPSGAGKSTLLGALTGSRVATFGTVIWQGQSLYDHYEQLKYQIGLVPQQDIQHSQLTVRQALSFAALLRLPPDMTLYERGQRVHAVAGQLQLMDRLENRIGSQLSGGQRKRVSIATELLTAPPLLFLDEPTSGLDPGLDVDVMGQLRELADDDRIVVVVTHSVLALSLCDNVLVLAPGGWVAYFGPPDGVLDHFGCADYPMVFRVLGIIPRRDPEKQHSPTLRLPDSQRSPHVALGRRVASRAALRVQFATLVRRNLAVIAADRLLLALLIVLPLGLGALSRVVPGEAGLSLFAADRDPAGGLIAEEAAKRITILIVAAALIGTAMSIRELVGERAIFRREHAVGLVPEVYLASKLLVLGLACFCQGVVVTVLATWGLPGPDFGGALAGGRLEVALAIGALSFAMSAAGLVLSAFLTSSEQAMPALVAMVMVQLVLSGSLVEIAGRPLLSQLAWLAPARWGYAAVASSVSIQRPLREKGLDLDWIAVSGGWHWLMNVAVLGLLTLGLSLLGAAAVRRSATER